MAEIRRRWGYTGESGPCSVCGVQIGEYHMEGCVAEVCLGCGERRVFCACYRDLSDEMVRDEMVRDGDAFVPFTEAVDDVRRRWRSYVEGADMTSEERMANIGALRLWRVERVVGTEAGGEHGEVRVVAVRLDERSARIEAVARTAGEGVRHTVTPVSLLEALELLERMLGGSPRRERRGTPVRTGEEPPCYRLTGDTGACACFAPARHCAYETRTSR